MGMVISSAKFKPTDRQQKPRQQRQEVYQMLYAPRGGWRGWERSYPGAADSMRAQEEGRTGCFEKQIEYFINVNTTN